MINRLVLFLSIIGMILCLHLWIQKERGFDQGCLGLSKAEVRMDATGCRDPALERYSKIGGVSTAALGYMFYFAVALLAFAKVVASEKIARRSHLVTAALVAVAFVMSEYLAFYQIFVARAVCPLCMLSTVLVTFLGLLLVLQRINGGYEPVPEGKRLHELGHAAGIVFAGTGTMVAVLLFVEQIGTRRLDRGAEARQFNAMLGRTLPMHVDKAALKNPNVARLTREIPPIVVSDWVDAGIPPLGDAKGVPVFLFLDPNCPHCPSAYENMTKLVERYKDDMALYVYPRPLWDFSMQQVAALEIAKRNNAYHEMWRLQLGGQKKGGLGTKDIEEFFRKLSLDTKDLSQRLKAEIPQVLALRDKARKAKIDGSPMFFINGIAVTGADRNNAGIEKLIAQAIEAKKSGRKIEPETNNEETDGEKNE